MEATIAKSCWGRAFGMLFGIGTQIGFAITVFFLFFYLRDGSSSRAPNWVLIDAALALQFTLVHSFLLLPRVRSWLGRVMAPQFYGCLFCVATCAGLGLMIAFWRSSSTVVWDTAGYPAAVLRAGYYAAWVGLVLTLRVTGFGYQTGWTQWLYWYRRESLPRRPFINSGIYRWFRHPAYACFLGLIWFTPRMTVDHALLTAIWTAYVFIGSYLKDLRLTHYLGDTYREYASRVPGYPGIFFGPLSKWPRPMSLAKTQNGSDCPQKQAA